MEQHGLRGKNATVNLLKNATGNAREYDLNKERGDSWSMPE